MYKEVKDIVDYVVNHFLRLAVNKYSSNVVEKVLSFSNQEIRRKCIDLVNNKDVM